MATRSVPVLLVVARPAARPCPRRTTAPPPGARRARGTAGGRCRRRRRSATGASERRTTSSTSAASSSARPRSAPVGEEGRQPDGPVARRRAASRAPRPAWPSRSAPAAAGGGHEPVDRGRRMSWASAPGSSSAIRATTWRARSVGSSAHSADRAARQVAAEARRRGAGRRPASSSSRLRSCSRNEPRRFCSTSRRASSTASSVSAATRGDVQELEARRAPTRSRQQERGADGSPPEAIGTSARRPPGTAPARPRAAARRRSGAAPASVDRAGGRRGAQPRDHDGHRRADRLGGQRAHASEALAADHRGDHAHVDGAQPLRPGPAPRRAGQRPLATRRGGQHGPAPAAARRRRASGWACRVSSPLSPVRMRYACSTGMTNTLPSPIEPVRACRRMRRRPSRRRRWRPRTRS